MTNDRRAKCAFVVAVLFLASMLCFSATSLAWAKSEKPKHVADELLVQFKLGTSDGKAKEALQAQGGAAVAEIKQIRTKRIKVPTHALEKVKAALAKNPHILFAEENFIAAGAFEPNDDQYARQWHLPKISAPAGWDLTTGTDLEPIAVIDSGVDPSHPDLKGKLVGGYNFLDNNTDTHDVLGHGTAVAGTAAAASNNIIGVAGVAWENPVVPLVVLDPNNWATYYDIAQAITYAVDHGVRVINISIGGSSRSSTLQNAVNYAWNHGAVIFACAHNYATSTPYYPAACDYAVAISATTSADLLASFSNYGNWIDVAAPGTSIRTTNRGGGYGSWNGTSFSSPMAAGLAALMLSVNPDLTNAQLVELITQHADDLGAPGFDPYFGHGRIAVYQTLLAAVNAIPESDTINPTVAVTAPGHEATVSGTIVVTVSATDDVAVDSVELYLDGELFATDWSAPFSFAWDTTQDADGSYELVALAYDTSGNVGQAGPVMVTVSNPVEPEPVDDLAPRVSITAPEEGSTVSKNVAIKASAFDNVAVAKMALYLDGIEQSVQYSSSLKWRWNVRKASSGEHTVSVKAFDRAGNVGTDSIRVSVK